MPAPVLSRFAFAMLFGVCLLAREATAQERLVYLFPAPQFLAAFAPFNVAINKGYYRDEQLEMEFKVARGGADVASRLHEGDGDLGGGTGDTAILMRPAGKLVRTVAVLGGGSLTQLVVRADARVLQPEDLRGKRVSVVSETDTSYYALLGFLQSIGLARGDVGIVPGGPVGVFKNVIDRKADLMVGVPDWIPPFTQSGTEIHIMQIGRFFPNMAQAVIATDRRMKERPNAVRGFVRATMRGLKDVINDPAGAADLIVAMFQQHKDNPAAVRDTIAYYARHVYPGQRIAGEVNELRIGKLQDFYLAEGIIARASPIKDLYTNEFILCAECVPTLAGTPAPPSKLGELKMQLSARSVYFDFDSAQLKAEYRQVLQDHARYLASHPSVKVQLIGYTDLLGNPEHNRTLGQRRAEAVKRALVAAGVNEKQIAAVGAGADPRIVSPKDTATPWLNRRADIIY
jgi:NitT/TauT family transport system substrate-binding protein